MEAPAAASAGSGSLAAGMATEEEAAGGLFGSSALFDRNSQANGDTLERLADDAKGGFIKRMASSASAAASPNAARLSELTAAPTGLFGQETGSSSAEAPAAPSTSKEAVLSTAPAASLNVAPAHDASTAVPLAVSEPETIANAPETSSSTAAPLMRTLSAPLAIDAAPEAAATEDIVQTGEPASMMMLAADTTSMLAATAVEEDAPPQAVDVGSFGAETPGGPVPGGPVDPGPTVPPDQDPIVTVPTGAPNKITIENAKQGNPRSEWGVEGDGDGNIQGFATEISTNIGGTVDFKIATDSTQYRIDIYRMGYYGGDGARKVDTIEKSLTTAQIQPHPIVDMSRGLIDCGNWSVSASWEIPEDAVSGVYFAKLVREDGTEGASIVPFIVRDDASTSDVVFQTADTTWQAYNAWGGASLYYGEVPVDPADMIGYMPPNCSCGLTAIGRASAVSYNRPLITTTSPVGGEHDTVFGVEHAAIQWLEQNGYDVSYISGVDTTRSGTALLNHEAYLSVGHDEYWSAEQRQNVEAARDAGVDLAFWGGNDCYWKVRWETSIDGSGTPYRTMVCYKETFGTGQDPSDTATGTWRDPRYTDPGQEPENALIGTMFTVDSYRQDAITVGSDFKNLRFWRNTDVADLQDGQSVELTQNILGYEWNSDVENGFRPAGLVNLSLSSISVDTYLRDYGSTVGPGEATHSLTMYRDDSGALVFSAGTVFWSWGLNSNHLGPSTDTDANVQQAMVNMFADMGIQPSTLDASLILATQSTDHVGPTSTITTPLGGSSFVEGQHVTITGTALDTGGGVIAGVEVSTDGGAHWFKATGRESWSYDWVVQASGTYQIMSRAVDDSVNLETPSAGLEVTVTLPETTGLWTLGSKPATETVIDRDGVELGVRFETVNGGLVEGIRFYKGFYNTGPHTVSLWTANGTLLATGVSTGESLSGWQTVNFSSPVAITAGTTYVASYHSDGFYSVDEGGFSSAYANGQVRVDPDGGVFVYGSTSAFPTNSGNGSNYWVDVVLDAGPNNAPVAVDDAGLSVHKDNALTITVSSLLANDNDPNNDALKLTAVGQAAHGTVSLDAQAGTITFTPDAGYTGAASFGYTIADGRGGIDQGEVDLNVDGDPPGVSVFAPGEGPTGGVDNDGQPLELGMKFVASANGSISALKFYRPAGDSSVHTGSLWTATGTRLATVTFTAESASGWQTAQLSSPVSITAGTTYVASYHTAGSYVATANYFSTAHGTGAVTAPSSASSGGNGVYAYSSSSVFPTSSFGASNYWVDVVFNQLTGNVAPVANNDNGLSATVDTPRVFAFSELLANDTDANGDTLTITAVSNPSNGTLAIDTEAKTITFTPTAGYTGPAGFTYTVSDGHGGSASANASMTVSPPSTTVSLYGPTDGPTGGASNDGNPVELGVKFTSSQAGTITGMRYYKSAQDTGTHVGSLWTATGTLLATATFSNESASGWQTVTFAQPVSITAGTTYVASYQSNGNYLATANYFTTSRSNGPLTAPSSASSGGNGVYAYGSGNQFPNQSYSASNYWVDVVFQPPPSGNVAPVANNDNGLSATVDTPRVFAFSELLANDTDANGDTLTITAVSNPSNGTLAIDTEAKTITFTPTAGYTGPAGFTYTVSDGHGGSASANASMTVSPPSTTVSLYGPTDGPTGGASNDGNPVELGVKFTSSQAGTITGMRYYKSAQDTGTHVGSLWTATGTLLATATFSNESASGWQTVTFAQPVSITAGTTYVASYQSNGNYLATANYFTTSHSSGPLTAPSSASSGGNGVYAYGSGNQFPNQSYGASNYWVDVTFQPPPSGNVAPVANNDSGLSTQFDTPVVIQASALLANDTDANGDTLTITGASDAQHGQVTFDQQANTVTFTPTAGYSGAAGFTYAISDGEGGTASAQVTLSVQPQGQGAEQTVFAASSTPTTVSVNDTDPVNLGMKFQADVAGWVTGVRFYKASDNTGPHTGYLWTSTGTLVASVSFTNESASGWQQANFDTPVAIDPDTTYIVSYSTNGHYSATANGLASGVTSGDLRALSSALSGGNGVYDYGVAGTFPDNSYNSTNYYVDVAFRPQLAA